MVPAPFIFNHPKEREKRASLETDGQCHHGSGHSGCVSYEEFYNFSRTVFSRFEALEKKVDELTKIIFLLTAPVQLQISELNVNLGAGPATEVLCLYMISLRDLLHDDKCNDIALSVHKECTKYGTVLGLEIPRPIKGVEVPGVGKIFVEFKTTIECQKAYAALRGQRVLKCVVATLYFDSERYHRREF